MLGSEYFFLPCFPVKKCFLLKVSKDTFLLLHYPLPVFELRGIKLGVLASCYFSEFQLAFCLLHFIQPVIINSALHEPVIFHSSKWKGWLCAAIPICDSCGTGTGPCTPTGPGWDTCPHDMVTL